MRIALTSVRPDQVTPAMALRFFLALSLLALTVRGVPLHPRTASGLVIVTLDTARADRLSTYGFMDAAFPAIERLAREGIIFDRASSVVPLTKRTLDSCARDTRRLIDSIICGWTSCA